MDALTLVGINILLWLISLPLGKTWPVDLIWSNWPVYQAVAIYVRSRGGGACGTADRQVLTLSLVCVWGFRLTSNFCSRGGIGGEDWRYADMRRKLGGHFWWVSLFAVFLGQTAFLFLPCLSLYGALGELPGAGAPLGTADWAGGAVSLAGIALEAAADGQMDAFLASAALAAAAAGGGGGRGRREGEREGGGGGTSCGGRHERGAVGVQPAPELPGRDYVLVGPVPAVALRHGALEGVRARSPDAPVRPRLGGADGGAAAGKEGPGLPRVPEEGGEPAPPAPQGNQPAAGGNDVRLPQRGSGGVGGGGGGARSSP